MPKLNPRKQFLHQLTGFTVNSFLINGFCKPPQTAKKEERRLFEELVLFSAMSQSTRYFVPFIYNSVPKSRGFINDVVPYLDNARFKALFRVGRETFQVIFELVRKHGVFKKKRGNPQHAVYLQLLVTLYRLGSYGEGCSVLKIATMFGLGDGGTVANIINRVFRALLDLQEKYLFWPSRAERQQLAEETMHEMPGCIMYVDGTEINLAERPVTDPDSYLSRKQRYSLKAQVICDWKLRIRHLVLGYPGSVHDSRIFNNCPLSLMPTVFFSGDEYILGDSAYKLSTTVITPYRVNSTSEGSASSRNTFNKELGKYRVRIENCIGLLKERFYSLKELKIRIKEKEDIEFACNWILVCGILHNIIQNIGDESDFIEVPEIEKNISKQAEDIYKGAVPCKDAAMKRYNLMKLLYARLD